MLFHNVNYKSASHCKTTQDYLFEILEYQFGMVFTNFKNAITILKESRTISREIYYNI